MYGVELTSRVLEAVHEERARKRRASVNYSDIVAALVSKSDLKAFMKNAIENGRQYIRCATAYLTGRMCSMRLKDIQISPTETLSREAAEQIFGPESTVGIEQYKANIIDAVNGIDDIWILRELYKMILHVTEDED